MEIVQRQKNRILFDDFIFRIKRTYLFSRYIERCIEENWNETQNWKRVTISIDYFDSVKLWKFVPWIFTFL